MPTTIWSGNSGASAAIKLGGRTGAVLQVRPEMMVVLQRHTAREQCAVIGDVRTTIGMAEHDVRWMRSAVEQQVVPAPRRPYLARCG